MGLEYEVLILGVIAVIFGSVIIQFLYNIVFIKPYHPVLKKGGDGKLTKMLYESEFLADSYFEDEVLISSNLEGALERIYLREDCADFTANALIRFYLENEHRLTERNKREIKDCLIRFKYWMDQYDGRKDSMCHWSENHQILFAVTEYLAGIQWSDEIFADGNSGLHHVKLAKKRIEEWMKQRFYYGFSEYYSNNYYPEDIAAMANFIQFADKEEKDMVVKMKIIMDIIWLDIATQSYRYKDEAGDVQYAFLSASGRMYMDNKTSNVIGNKLRPYINLVLENGKSYMKNTQNFFVCFRRMYTAKVDGKPIYEVPDVVKEIFKDDSAVKMIKSSNGITLKELEKEGFVGENVGQLMMQMGMEVFTNEEVIDNTMKYLKKNKLFYNSFLNQFKLIDLWPLTWTNCLSVLTRFLNPSTNGKAIQKANVYTYRTPYYAMSTMQEYFPGNYADQQQISLSTLSGDISVYHSQPMRNHTNSQYWVGYGRLPYSVQDENVNITIYQLPQKRGILEPHIVNYTHAYFPVGLFDEVNTEYLTKGYIFGRKKDTYVMMGAKSDGEAELIFKNDMEGITQEELIEDRKKIKTNVKIMIEESGDYRYDLVFKGGKIHAWVTELSSIEQDKFFADFIRRVLENRYTLENMEVNYATNEKCFEVKYDNYFKINDKTIDTKYARYENKYVDGKIERGAEDICFSFHEKSLVLNYNKGVRKKC